MVPEEDEICERFGSVRLVGGESLVSHRTVFSRDSKYVINRVISCRKSQSSFKPWRRSPDCLLMSTGSYFAPAGEKYVCTAR